MKNARRYYVYALVDPRDGMPFYYGKGTGRRAYQHISEYQAGRISNQRKHARIASILDQGLSVEVRFIERKMTAAGALALETKLIAKHHSSITNWWRGDKERLDLQGGCYRCYLRKQREDVEALIRRLRPMRDWVKLTCRLERRKPTPQDIDDWMKTRDWLVETHALIEQKIKQFN